MELVTVRPTLGKSVNLPLRELRIAPLADIQYGAQGCDVDRLQRHIKWCLGQDCYFVGVGDYVDVASPSNRRKWLALNGEFYDSMRAAIDDKFDKELKEVQKILAPTRGRWLGLVRGHHYWPFADGTESDSRLAEYLGCKFLGDSGVIFIEMGQSVARLMLWHGSGGGATAGAMLNKIEHTAKRWNVHIALMAHQHQKPAMPVPMMDFGKNSKGEWEVVHQNRYLIGAGSFLRGYETGTTDPHGLPSGSYVEKAMLPPVALGAPIIYLRPRTRSGLHVIDINASI